MVNIVHVDIEQIRKRIQENVFQANIEIEGFDLFCGQCCSSTVSKPFSC